MWGNVVNPGPFTLGMNPQLGRNYRREKFQFHAGIETPTDSGAF
jgi:hypothetical protein